MQLAPTTPTMKPSLAYLLAIVAMALPAHAESNPPATRAADPFAAYLDGKTPSITREIAPVPDDIVVRRVLFRSRDKNDA